MHKRRAAQRRRARRGRSFRRPMAAGCFVVIHFRLRMFSVARHVVFRFEQAASSTRAAVKCTLAAYQTVRRSTPEVAARVVRRGAFPCDSGELCLKIIKLSLLKKLKTQRYTPKNTANHTHVYMSCMSCMYRHCRG